MLPTAPSRERWLFWLVAVLVLATGLGLRDPWPADEPRFALVARQMVESGQWLFPMRGDELYSDKPPLFMWLQAIAIALTGHLRVGFLLPSLLASLGTLWLVRDLGTRLFSREAGAHAGWALLFAVQFTFQARRAQIDPVLVFFVTLSAYGLLRHVLRGPDWRLWMLGWFAAGLGVISKGVGVIALLVLVPAGVAIVRGWPGAGGMHWRDARAWLGPVALFVPVLAWLVPMLLAVRASADPALQAYADDILLRQTAKRYADPWHHHQPAWYFLEVIATQWLPTSLALLWAWRPWRDALRARDARLLVLLGSVVLIVLFFSLSAGKREVYILPALPLLCLALGPWLPAILERRSARALALGLAALLAGACLLAGALLLLGEPGFERRLAEARGLADADALGALLLAIGSGGAGLLALCGPRRGVAALAGTLATFWVLVGLVGAPLLNDASSARGLMQRVGRHLPPGDELALVAWKEQLALMADRPVRTFGFRREPASQWRDALAWQAADPARRWILVEDVAMPACVDRRLALDMGRSNRRGWWLLPARAVRCGPAAALR
ncbi:glycosyltransferase family 39 protein [Lysobacter sp. N42]|uniref:ArnT family glycosyltransferase n=1 Tax=Lysobacter sp. N42 TaxID=2545719 RepID=UPI00104461DB|nr:glycosyltransferase family 39 protein [Lysobacter sp. N42]TCZ84338.1 glycosyltransferase family 39 protein [Lysobacter sp. N42]